MKPGRIVEDDDTLKMVIAAARTIAVVGLSPRPERDSHRVAAYLQARGMTIIPVHPAAKEILGEPVRPSLDAVEVPVDIVDVFLDPRRVVPIAEQALRLRPRLFWMQLEVGNPEAAELLTAAGVDVVMNRCLKIEHARLCR